MALFTIPNVRIRKLVMLPNLDFEYRITNLNP